MPRVVPDQRKKFESDESFKKLRRESEVTYTGSRDRPFEERRIQLKADCEKGHADLAFVATGTNMQLMFLPNSWSEGLEDRRPTREFVDFLSDPGKVYLKSQFIFNGVCVLWKGWIDLHTLNGAGTLEFDQERAQAEDAILQEQNEENLRRVQELDEIRLQQQQQQQQQQERELQAATEVEAAVRRKHRHRHLMCDALHIYNRHNVLNAKLFTKESLRHISSATSGSNGRHRHRDISIGLGNLGSNSNSNSKPGGCHDAHNRRNHKENGHPDRDGKDQKGSHNYNKELLGETTDKPIRVLDNEAGTKSSSRSSYKEEESDGENEHVDVDDVENDEPNIKVPETSEETDMEVEVDSKSDVEPEPDVEVLADVEEEPPARDKIRKSDTIWSPWK